MNNYPFIFEINKKKEFEPEPLYIEKELPPLLPKEEKEEIETNIIVIQL